MPNAENQQFRPSFSRQKQGFKRRFTGKTLDEIEALRDAKKCYNCEEEGHFATNAHKGNSQDKDDKSDRKGKKPKPSATLVPDLDWLLRSLWFLDYWLAIQVQVLDWFLRQQFSGYCFLVLDYWLPSLFRNRFVSGPDSGLIQDWLVDSAGSGLWLSVVISGLWFWTFSLWFWTVADAIKLPTEGLSMRARDRKVEGVFKKDTSAAIFNDINMRQVQDPTHLYQQHFHFVAKQPARYTTPNHAVASTFTQVLRSTSRPTIDHTQYVMNALKATKKEGKVTYLGAPEVLTRIAYHAIGMADNLPPAPEQNTWDSAHRVSPRKTRSTKRGRTVIEESSEESAHKSGEEEPEEPQQGPADSQDSSNNAEKRAKRREMMRTTIAAHQEEPAQKKARHVRVKEAYERSQEFAGATSALRSQQMCNPTPKIQRGDSR
ncbi:hypothetical protein L7F22_004073 [Adiantum nelumboides]|nr:hypothetical protein [Adiantum nelumboides]